jgi:AsmA protein
LRYIPLMAGRIEIAGVTLVRPTITVSFLPDGQSNWSGLIEALARALRPDPERTASFSEIGIQDGTVVIHQAGAGKDATDRLDDVEFQLAWPSISRSFGASGRFHAWRLSRRPERRTFGHQSAPCRRAGEGGL